MREDHSTGMVTKKEILRNTERDSGTISQL
jgi:hypothetical protein